MNQNILFTGMDVHKESIEIAISDGDTQETRHYGKIGGTRDAMCKALTSRKPDIHFNKQPDPYLSV